MAGHVSTTPYHVWDGKSGRAKPRAAGSSAGKRPEKRQAAPTYDAACSFQGSERPQGMPFSGHPFSQSSTSYCRRLQRKLQELPNPIVKNRLRTKESFIF
jgi:hypothetical protein